MTKEDEVNMVKKSIFKDLRDYMTSVKILFPRELQLSISKRIDMIYFIGNKKEKTLSDISNEICTESQKSKPNIKKLKKLTNNFHKLMENKMIIVKQVKHVK